MQVRHATRSDLGQLAEIEATADRQFRDFFGRDPGWGTPPSGQHRAAAPGFLLVAVEGDEKDEVVGFVHVLELEGIAHLEQISVRRDRQRRGTGRTLIEAAKATACDRGHDRLSLLTYADVPWNAPFYATCGFVEIEPVLPVHRRLREIEQDLRLDRHGRRVLMVAPVTSQGVTSQ